MGDRRAAGQQEVAFARKRRRDLAAGEPPHCGDLIAVRLIYSHEHDGDAALWIIASLTLRENVRFSNNRHGIGPPRAKRCQRHHANQENGDPELLQGSATILACGAEPDFVSSGQGDDVDFSVMMRVCSQAQTTVCAELIFWR